MIWRRVPLGCWHLIRSEDHFKAVCGQWCGPRQETTNQPPAGDRICRKCGWSSLSLPVRQEDLKRRMLAKRARWQQAKAVERVRARGRVPYQDLLAAIPEKRNRRPKRGLTEADAWRKPI